MSGPMGDAGLTSSQVGILQLNNLQFKLDPDMAVVTQRISQSSYFEGEGYFDTVANVQLPKYAAGSTAY